MEDRHLFKIAPRYQLDEVASKDIGTCIWRDDVTTNDIGSCVWRDEFPLRTAAPVGASNHERYWLLYLER
jgi:hypothetical protein